MQDEIQAIFDALAAPFDPSEIKTRDADRGKTRKFQYINATTARRRLNEVLGPAGWECDVAPNPDSVKCSLTIHLPDGRSITRAALGGYPEMPTAEDRVKGGDSDAFKRAAALFGVAAYLYDDAHPPQAPPRRNGPPPQPQPPRNNGKQTGRWGSPGNNSPAAHYQAPTVEHPRSNGTRPSRDTPQALFYQQLTDLQRTHRNGRGLVSHLGEWGRGQGLPALIKDWPECRLADAQEEARQYLHGVTAESN